MRRRLVESFYDCEAAMERIKYYSCATLFSFFVILWFSTSVMALEVGARAPDFTLLSIQDEEVSLSDFNGRLVLLKIGTTWCPGCKVLSREIGKVDSLLKERGVVVLDVFVQDTKVMVEKDQVGKTRSMTYHALVDNGRVHKGYSVYLIPRLLVVDAEQIVRYDSAGRDVSADEIRAMVEDFDPGQSGKLDAGS